MSTTFLIILIVAFLFTIVFQIGKANEYVAILKGEAAANEESDNINGWLFFIFLFAFLIGIGWSLKDSWSKMILVSASEHGRWIDSMFNTTTLFTGIVFVACHIMLFWFCLKYRGKRGKVAYYYPENNKLEMWWTIVPAIVLTVLIVIGLYNWFKITGPAPAGTTEVDITGKQFEWLVRYPGKDGKLGKKEFKYIDNDNALGLDFHDEASKDDFMTNEIHFEVNKPVLLKIYSRDVIHDVGMPHFSVKMDAVPGIPTRFWFKPMVTTDEMKKQTGNPDFIYELACDMLCGSGHSAMRRVIVIDTHEQYVAWLAKQKSFYETQVVGTDLGKKFAMNSASSTEAKTTNP